MTKFIIKVAAATVVAIFATGDLAIMEFFYSLFFMEFITCSLNAIKNKNDMKFLKNIAIFISLFAFAYVSGFFIVSLVILLIVMIVNAKILNILRSKYLKISVKTFERKLKEYNRNVKINTKRKEQNLFNAYIRNLYHEKNGRRLYVYKDF